jgi:hypothetical protein
MTKLVSFLMVFLLATRQTDKPKNEFSPEVLLKPKVAGPHTLAANGLAGASFETLAERTGLNIVFYRGFNRDTPNPLRIENATIVEAFDQLAAQTQNFWFPWNSKTIVVAPDNPQVRRAIEPLLTKTIYLGNTTTTNNINALMNTLRTKYQLRGVFQNEEARAFTIRDTASRIALAEHEAELVSNSVRQAATSLTYPENSTDYMSIAENGRVRRLVPSNRSHLEKTLVESVTIDVDVAPQAVYEDLAQRAGLDVVFDNRMKPLPAARFHLEKADLLDALDLLALQSGTVWQPVNNSTIFVMEDSAQNRREFDAQVIKVLYLSDRDALGSLRSPEAATYARNGYLNLLRTSVALRYIFSSRANNALIIKDTPLRVFLAEKVLGDLDKGTNNLPPVTLKAPTSLFLSQNGWVLGRAALLRPKLDVKFRSVTNIRLDAPARAAYEALADMAGLKVEFDSRFVTAPQAPLHLTGVDVLDALDLLSLQTRNFWQVVDERTNRVIPNTVAARKELEPHETRTFVPPDTSKEGVAEVANLLRTVLGLVDVKVEDETKIVVTDTVDNLALVTQVFEIVNKPR